MQGLWPHCAVQRPCSHLHFGGRVDPDSLPGTRPRAQVFSEPRHLQFNCHKWSHHKWSIGFVFRKLLEVPRIPEFILDVSLRKPSTVVLTPERTFSCWEKNQSSPPGRRWLLIQKNKSSMDNRIDA
ncbi:ubiquitin-like protein 3 isoform X2 [Phacochoerus africanus]|uniref:ubiquitin-like protein 3 isoform X2 n=1 Tax=Phacochoerus africanus TaxID=41426 RepID=UPI001FD9F460|nr:ubiquitin-like protein 3 isoform X2 [Phacochoerus africanus]